MGLFVMGGLMAVSAKTARASVVLGFQPITAHENADVPWGGYYFIFPLGGGFTTPLGEDSTFTYFMQNDNSSSQYMSGQVMFIAYANSDYTGFLGSCVMYQDLIGETLPPYSGPFPITMTWSGGGCYEANSGRYYVARVLINSGQLGTLHILGSVLYSPSGPTGYNGGYDPGYYINTEDSLLGTPAYQWNSGDYNPNYPPTPPVDNTTRIIDFQPEDGTTTPSGLIQFGLHAYINPNDIGGFLGNYQVELQLHNTDENVYLLKVLSPYTMPLLNTNATTSGDFYFATSTPLPDGNYMVEARLTRSSLWGASTLLNPWGAIVEDHYFKVNKGTFIGELQTGISRGIAEALGEVPTTTQASTTQAQAKTCNPVSGDFDTIECGAFLFIPDSQQMSNTFKSVKEGMLQKMPFGYAYRMVELLASSSTSTLPVLSYTFPADGGGPLAGDTFSFDTSAYMVQAAAVIGTMKSNIDHTSTLWDVLGPVVKLFLYIVLIYAMIQDVLGLNLTNRLGGHGSLSDTHSGNEPAKIT
jgi:hypothetical protein